MTLDRSCQINSLHIWFAGGHGGYLMNTLGEIIHGVSSGVNVPKLDLQEGISDMICSFLHLMLVGELVVVEIQHVKRGSRHKYNPHMR